jgi:integrase
VLDEAAADAMGVLVRYRRKRERSLHDLRHFYASALIGAGCDVVTVQKALGHAKATTTLDTYSHLWPDAEDRTRNAAAAVMRTALAVEEGGDEHAR